MTKTRKSGRCWNCKNRTLVGSAFRAERKIGGRTFVAELPALVCTICGERTIAGPDLAGFDAAVASEIARTGISSPDALRFLRKSIAITAAELGALLELRPETISRIENGKMAADRRTLALLGSLALDHLEGRTDTADRLRALAHPPKARKRVEVRARVA
jgi:DNA-binding XRE family transcriptional regulator